MADRGDLAFVQGDDYAAVVTINKGQQPDVIAGYTAKAQVREGPADEFSNVVAEIVTTVSTPLVNLSIPKAVTADMCGDYVWDLELTAPDGTTSTVMTGAVRVTLEVTRA